MREVDAPASVVVVDLPLLLASRVGPVGEAPGLHPAEDLVDSSSETRKA
jgi:hypothetical protein